MSYARSGNVGSIIAVFGQVTFDLASCGAAAVTLQTVPIPDALPGDAVILTPPPGGLSVAVGALPGYVAAAGSCRVPVINPTAAPLDAASVTFDYSLIRRA